MRRNWMIALLGCTAALGTPVHAQSGQLDVELTSEMWALAGVCSQYSTYRVSNEALANWLNAELANAGNAADVMDSKTAKLEQIGTATAAVSNSRSVTVREERSDRLTASLMTRCRALTNNPVASRFFFTATG